MLVKFILCQPGHISSKSTATNIPIEERIDLVIAKTEVYEVISPSVYSNNHHNEVDSGSYRMRCLHRKGQHIELEEGADL